MNSMKTSSLIGIVALVVVLVGSVVAILSLSNAAQDAPEEGDVAQEDQAHTDQADGALADTTLDTTRTGSGADTDTAGRSSSEVSDASVSEGASSAESSSHSAAQSQGAAQSTSAAATDREGIYTEYTTARLADATDGTVVLFFHAPWCPTCQAADRDIRAHSEEIPSGLTILKTDFDDEDDLKKQYGVTFQHTFVEVDAQGNKLQIWNGGNLQEIVRRVGLN